MACQRRRERDEFDGDCSEGSSVMANWESLRANTRPIYHEWMLEACVQASAGSLGWSCPDCGVSGENCRTWS